MDVICKVLNEFVSKKEGGKRITPVTAGYQNFYKATEEEYERLSKAGCLEIVSEVEAVEAARAENINSDLEEVLNAETETGDDADEGEGADAKDSENESGGIINSMKNILGG